MRRFFTALLDLLLPSFCLACDKPLGSAPELLFCPDCLKRLTFIHSPLCPCCGRVYLVAAGGDHLCGACLAALVVAGLTFAFMLKKQREIDCPS